jgi:tetratricopeptide (TPR) repeat protein
MARASFPEIPHAALKNHATPERLERVWRRIDLDRARSPSAQRRQPWWALAAAAGIFGLGVFVGSRLSRPAAEVTAMAEPRVQPRLPGAAPLAEALAPAPRASGETPRKHPDRARALPTTLAAEEAPAEAIVDIPAPATPPNTAPALPPEWLALADAGDFMGAKLVLERTGGFDRALGSANAGELMSLADIARASGQRELALQALRRVLSAYASAPEAPIAAWTLGNLLEQAGDKLGAADAYATYRRLSPAGDFAEDAAARQVDVALSQGNLELSARAMDEYAENFPKGRRLSEFRARLSALALASDSVEPPQAEATPESTLPAEPTAAPSVKRDPP